MIRVVETVHHGSYRNVRVVELPDLAPSSLARMVRDCPYSMNIGSEFYFRLQRAIESGGSYARGWVTWEVRK